MTAVLVLILRLALAIALYAFIGWVLVTLWREIKQQGDFLALQKKPGVRLQVKLESGQVLHQRYTQSEVTIGRAPNCDIALIDDAVSAHHARISYHHNQWWLEDLNSTNGTFIGKSRLSVPTVLIPDEEFRCGNTLFTIYMDSVDDSLDL